MTSQPLVTVVQLCYNNELFISKALQSILEQTYRPLQIIIADDCSSDNSYRIVEEMVRGYSGPHQLLLQQNETNLGLGNNLNRAMALAKGELVVESDGDDISFPERVADTVRCWQDSDGKAKVFCGKSPMIDAQGREAGCLPRLQEISLEEAWEPSAPLWVQGGSLAWHRSIFEIFGPLRPGVVAQDKAIGFRSLLLESPIAYIDKPVIQYRTHPENLTNNRTLLEELRDKAAMYASFVQDYQTASAKGYRGTDLEQDSLFRQLAAVHANFTKRHQIMSAGLLKSLILLLSSGSSLTAQQKWHLFKKRCLR